MAINIPTVVMSIVVSNVMAGVLVALFLNHFFKKLDAQEEKFFRKAADITNDAIHTVRMERARK